MIEAETETRTFEGQKISTVVTAALGKNSYAATVVEDSMDSVVNLCLIELGRNLEADTLEAVRNTLGRGGAIDECTILGHVIATRQLLHCDASLKAALEPNLLGALYLKYLGCGSLVIDLGEHKRTANLEQLVFEVGSDTSYEAGVVDGVGEVNLALRRLGRVHGSADRHHARQTGHGADELALHGLFGDEELDAAVRLGLDHSHQHERVDELSHVSRRIAARANCRRTWFACGAHTKITGPSLGTCQLLLGCTSRKKSSTRIEKVHRNASYMNLFMVAMGFLPLLSCAMITV
jgi:hypothetical protein